MKRRLLSRPWCKKNRAPNRGHRTQRKKGVSVRSKTFKPGLPPAKVNNFSDEESLMPQIEIARKKPWSRKLKGIVKWLIILKLIAAIVNEVLQIFK